MSTAAVILAAGASSRMGSPKQALRCGGTSLLRRAALTALDAGCEPVVVVTGAHAEQSRRELDGLGVQETLNEEWPEGIASSIRAGVHYVAANTSADAVIVMLCDQPRVGADVLMALVAAHAGTAKPIVACRYADTSGVPALFARTVWADLTLLTGHSGAKQIIESDPSRVHLVPFPDGAIDIDTPADFSRL
jgi:molybdenum cofactor cytidylyltransferase